MVDFTKLRKERESSQRAESAGQFVGSVLGGIGEELFNDFKQDRDAEKLQKGASALFPGLGNVSRETSRLLVENPQLLGAYLENQFAQNREQADRAFRADLFDRQAALEKNISEMNIRGRLAEGEAQRSFEGPLRERELGQRDREINDRASQMMQQIGVESARIGVERELGMGRNQIAQGELNLQRQAMEQDKQKTAAMIAYQQASTRVLTEQAKRLEAPSNIKLDPAVFNDPSRFGEIMSAYGSIDAGEAAAMATVAASVYKTNKTLELKQRIAELETAGKLDAAEMRSFSDLLAAEAMSFSDPMTSASRLQLFSALVDARSRMANTGAGQGDGEGSTYEEAIRALEEKARLNNWGEEEIMRRKAAIDQAFER